MTIQKIYDKYQIMPNLQLHQLRVAGVAQILCDSIIDFQDKNDVVITCLLHDMGNIIKSDFSYFPEFLEPEGLEYWQEVKTKFIEKYSNDEHVATKMIVKEIIDSEKIIRNVDQIGFSKSQETEKDTSLSRKICVYSDMRVGPYGILSIQERLLDGSKRNQARKGKVMDTDIFEVCAKSLNEIEKQIFEKLSIRPEDITNDNVNEKIVELRKFEVV
jgi:predicted HD phosphohydrolase